MATVQTTNPRRSASTWQVALCFLLSALFLYNPFLHNQGQNGNLAVSHPVSHRATVGSSELEQFAQRHGAVAPLPDLDVLPLYVGLTAASFPASQNAVDREESLPPQRIFSSSLWFRPPPAV